MEISSKIRWVLTLFLVAFSALFLRVWQLSVVEREAKLLEAQKPQHRTLLNRSARGTISDRFHIPMALNRISYNAAIYYSQITEVPTIEWRDGTKVHARKEYIRNLAETLGKTLQLDPDHVEDLICSKAALFPHVPFIIKTSLTEEEHYRLKMLEKDWPGICAEINSIRHYPMGKTGCHLLGTIGAINQKEYSAIAQELTTLSLEADLFECSDPKRFQELKEKAYSIDDFIGKSGIEAQFEQELRGFFGKQVFEVDQKGRFVREIMRKEAVAGKEVVLSISSELQLFAEQLLIQNETLRDERSFYYDPKDKKRKIQKQPWIKGGAIVAIDPQNGEVLALASHPRFDPNDFVLKTRSVFNEEKAKEVDRWLGTEKFAALVWDGLDVLKREGTKSFQEESTPLSWDFYLDQILSLESPLRTFFSRVDTVRGVIQFQEDMEAMLYFAKTGAAVPAEVQKRVDAISLSQQDKLFAADLCRIAVYAPAFTDELIQKVGNMKISEYRALCQSFFRREAEMKKQAQEIFRKTDFKEWRKRNQKEFLAEKRKQEKQMRTYARPFLDYLEKKEKGLFSQYWEKEKWAVLATEEMPEELIRTFRSFVQMKRPLLGKYKNLRNPNKEQTEKDLASAFLPIGGFGFLRSYAYESSVPQGSIFKLVTAYEALRQGKQLTLVDEWSAEGVGYGLNGALYPRFYKGGRLPRSANPNLGKIDLLAAIERTSNPYFSILAGDFFNDPEDLCEAARSFGFGEKTGLELPMEKRGNIPKDLKENRTGLYSTAIGQHTLLTTPLQTACMLGTIANGGKLFKPKLVKEIGGLSPDRHPLKPFAAASYLAKEELKMLGIPFPLFTASQLSDSTLDQGERPTEIRRIVPMDEKIRSTLIEAMDRVVTGVKGNARASSIRSLLMNPFYMRDYLELQHQMIGKTGTAEIVCNLSINPSSTPQMYKYIWFGGICFKDAKKIEPELVVVVFLRFGDWGKEAGPLAAQMVHKWREIKKKHAIPVPTEKHPRKSKIEEPLVTQKV